MRRTRRRQPPPDLTSLFDVLFIVIFAALIRAAAVEQAASTAIAAAAAPVPPPPPPAAPPLPVDVAALRTRALAALDHELAARTPLVLRISATRTLDALEVDGRRIALAVPLLEPDPDPDVALRYAGDRTPDRRLCQIAALQLGQPTLAAYLVILAPAQPVAELPHALHDGLYRDLDRCFTDQRALATLIDPTAPALP